MNEPSLFLRSMDGVSRVYTGLFAESPAASVLSRPNPVRRTGFDQDLVVAERRHEAEDVVSLTLVDPDSRNLPGWVPGAHLDLFLPSGRQRQYSLCGDPADRTRYRIAVRRVTDGGGSGEIHSTITVGDTLRVRGPRNAFRFIDAQVMQAPSYYFIAGGIGITPILPMARAAAASSATWGLTYVGRSRATMPFLDELSRFAGDALDVRPDDESGVPDIAELLARAAPGAAVYVCGPPPLLDAARTVMPALNPTGSLHIERFSAPPVLGGAPFTVELARSDRTASVGADETALAAIRRTLPDVRYSCQQGYCGTCKVRVLAGDVDHRDRLLRVSEREDSMLICVSRAAGESVVLDL